MTLYDEEPKLEAKEMVDQLLPNAGIIKLKGYSKNNYRKNKTEEEIYKNAKVPASKKVDNKWVWDYLSNGADITEWIKAKGWIGTVIPENRIVIDVDHTISGELVKTLLDKEGYKHHCIKTPNGYQFIFKASEETTKQIRQISKWFSSIGVVIDTRTTGNGYIVFPTENTKNRYILSQAEELDELPSFLHPIWNTNDSKEKWDKEKSKEEQVPYVFPIPMEVGSRDEDLHRFASRLNRWGISEEEAEASIKLIYEYFMIDKTNFTEKQAFEKVRSAYQWQPEQKGLKPIGVVAEDGKIIPEPFHIKGNSLYKRVTTKEGKETEVLISRFAPAILKEFSNIERNSVHYDITWKNRGKEHCEVVPANVIATKKDLLTLAEKGFSCNDLNYKDLISYFDKYLAVNELEQAYMVERLGHIKNGPFIHPLESNGVEIIPNDSGEKQLLEAFQVKGTVDTWKKEVFSLIKEHPKVLFYVLASFGSVILKDLKIEPFVVEIAGSTSQGKTTALHVARSVHGTEGLINEWNATKVAIERKAGFLNSFPLYMDDTRKADERILQNVIYQFSGGRSKGRGSIRGSQKEFTWNDILLSTGEIAITEYAKKAAGAAARVISLVDEPFVNIDADFFNQLYQGIENNYGAVGLEFVKRWEQEKQNYLSQFHLVRQHYLDKSRGNEVLTRLSMYYAAVHFAGMVAQKFFHLDMDLKSLIHLFDEMAKENKAIDKPKQLLEELLFKLDANRKYLAYDYALENVWAIYKNGSIGFTPAFLKEELEVEEKMIRKEWQKRGYTVTQMTTDGKEVDYKKVKVHKSSYRAIFVSKEMYEQTGLDFDVDSSSIDKYIEQTSKQKKEPETLDPQKHTFNSAYEAQKYFK